MFKIHGLSDLLILQFTPPYPSAASLQVGGCLNLLDSLCATQPTYTVLGKLFYSGFQLGFVETEIVNCADTQDTTPWGIRAHAIHERATCGTEIVSHSVARGDGAVLAECLQIVLATQVLQVRIEDDEVGREHRRGDLAAVCAVANKAVSQARRLCWLRVWKRC